VAEREREPGKRRSDGVSQRHSKVSGLAAICLPVVGSTRVIQGILEKEEELKRGEERRKEEKRREKKRKRRERERKQERKTKGKRDNF
jgi:hypothetical protein